MQVRNVVAGVVIAGFTEWVMADGRHGSAPHDVVPERAAPRATAGNAPTTNHVYDAFAVVRSNEPELHVDDELPPAIVKKLRLDVAAGRRVLTLDGTELHLIPRGRHELCILHGASLLCERSRQARRRGMIGATLCSAGVLSVQVFGVVPDAARGLRMHYRTGATEEIPVTTNVFSVKTEEVPVAISWTADGHEREVPMPIPADFDTSWCNVPPPAQDQVGSRE